jgi:hypothetical protein
MIDNTFTTNYELSKKLKQMNFPSPKFDEMLGKCYYNLVSGDVDTLFYLVDSRIFYDFAEYQDNFGNWHSSGTILQFGIFSPSFEDLCKVYLPSIGADDFMNILKSPVYKHKLFANKLAQYVISYDLQLCKKDSTQVCVYSCSSVGVCHYKSII